ncbi:MAG: methyltransferase [Armatimonadetes bacterium]|nr:methyltransferase [Armatimonadota bacterium]
MRQTDRYPPYLSGPGAAMTPFYITTIPGLSDIAREELLGLAPDARITAIFPDRVVFDLPRDPERLLSLRLAEDLFVHLGELSGLATDESALITIHDYLASLDLSEALDHHARIHQPSAPPTFRITATRSGSHSFNSLQLAGEAGAGVVARYGWKANLKHPDVEIGVQLADNHACFGLRLSTDAMANRSAVSGVASLRPTVARAMCLLSDPQPGQVVLDPMCGTGTILAERAPGLPQATLIGSDRWPPALASAGQTLSGAGACLLLADAQYLPLADASIDRIITNPPWGRRVGSHRQDRRLYPRFLAEAVRVLKSGGLLVVLSLERRLMFDCLDALPELELLSRTLINIGGMQPSIYLLRRT